VKRFAATCLPILALALVPVSALAQAGAAGEFSVDRVPGTMTGTVVDTGGQGIAGVMVKIFEEGFRVEETETGGDGSYALEFAYLPDIDWTIMVWFVPPGEVLIPEIVILRESLKSKELELWSPCLPRIELGSRVKYDVTLFTEETKLAQMSELDCMKQAQ
jgi:hypothetical protein